MTEASTNGQVEPSALDQSLEPLDSKERRFVRELLRGEPPEDAAQTAGYVHDLRVVDLLGRPMVRRALLALAPLLATDARGRGLARGILRPYALARVAQNLEIAGQNGLASARDLLGASAADARSPRQAWEARTAAKARSGAADNPDSGNQGEAAG